MSDELSLVTEPKKKRGRPPKIRPAMVQEAAVASTPTAPTVSLTFDQLKELLATAQSSKDSSPELAAAILGLQATMTATTKLGDEIGRTVRRSNAHGQDVSIFNYKHNCDHCQHGTAHPETGLLGHPKPALLYDTYFPNGARVVADDCTIAEIELFNAFTASRSARDGKWTATLTKKGGRGRLIVDAPSFSLDQRAELPPLVQILMELLHGPQNADPALLYDQVQALNKRIQELEAKQVAV